MFKKYPVLSIFGVLIFLGFFSYGIDQFIKNNAYFLQKPQAIINLDKFSKPIHIPRGIHSIDTIFPSKEYTQTIGGLKATVKLGSDSINTKDGKGYMLVTLKGDQFPTHSELKRAPLNLALVIDRSGSMSGDKLEYVKKSLTTIGSSLTESDHVSLVIYDDKVETIYDDDFDQEEFSSVIQEITSRGSTNIEGGLKEGIKNVQGFSFIEDKNRVNRVILLSDGLANVGTSTPAGLARIVENLAEKNVNVSTIGVGVDYDENIMTQVALAGNGNYYFLEKPSDSEEIFAEEFNSMLHTIAKDIHIDLGVNGPFKVSRAIGYKMTNNNSFDPKNIYAGREVSYLFEIQSNNLETMSTDVTNLANVNITFQSIVTDRKEEITIPVSVQLTTKEINTLADNQVYKEFIDSLIAERLWDVDTHLEQVENQKAKSTVNNLLQELQYANIRLNGAYDKEIINLEQKESYLKQQGNRNIQEDAAGRLFKKSNQSSSFDKQYNK